MNIFTLLNKNKSKWLRYGSHEIEWFDEKGHLTIKEFMIKDNINYEKYMNNVSYDSKALFFLSTEEDIIKCTPTYKKYFVKRGKRKFCNGSIGINDWFYCGYPDVAIWLEKQYENEELPEFDQSPIDVKDRQVLLFFRFAIDEFKKTHGKLECEQ